MIEYKLQHQYYIVSQVWDLQDDGNMSKTLVSRSNWLYACKWSPNGRQVASVGDNRSVSSSFYYLTMFMHRNFVCLVGLGVCCLLFMYMYTDHNFIMNGAL